MGQALAKAAHAAYLAFQASMTASDSGGVAFNQHVDHAQAMRDNRAAWNAWDVAGRESRAVLSLPPVSADIKADQAKAAEWASDAKDRMGELDVALGMLRDDMRAHLRMRAKAPSPVTRAPMFRFLPDWTTGEKSKLALGIAVAVGVASKLLGAW